jgi:hypothetical protein
MKFKKLIRSKLFQDQTLSCLTQKYDDFFEQVVTDTIEPPTNKENFQFFPRKKKV